MEEDTFRLDGIDDAEWNALAFGPTWNGWATPVVDGATLDSILKRLGDGFRWDGDIAVVWPTIDLRPGEEHDPATEERVGPDAGGRYDLGILGWVFVRSGAETSDNRDEPTAGA